MTVILREDKDTKRWFVGYLVRPDGGGHEFDSVVFWQVRSIPKTGAHLR